MRLSNRSYYIYLSRTHYTDGTFSDVEVGYQTYKPKIGGKYNSIFWAKGYDTAVGYEAYKALCKRIGAYKGKITNEFAIDLAKDVIKNFDDDQAMWDYKTKITKIERELATIDKKNYNGICKVMKNIEKIVKHQ